MANYDESAIGDVVLPDLLTCVDGARVTTREEWCAQRRPELLELFASQVYGRTPSAPEIPLRFTVVDENPRALDGRATQRQVRISFGPREQSGCDLLLLLPNHRAAPAPVFTGLNFFGNHTTTLDESVPLKPLQFSLEQDSPKIFARGEMARRWPFTEIIARGYGVATACCHDFDPDFDDGFQNGVQPLFYRAGQTRPGPDEWGAIGAWAWGLSRIADYLLTLPGEVDPARIAVMGHSRLGKAALWAGAQDERFRFVISNNSGAGGASLARRIFGETAADLNTRFPHWFCANYRQYSGRENALPIDQHALLALMAPRPLYVASASEDQWADPHGEFLSATAAEPAYALYGRTGLGSAPWPPPGPSIGDCVGYHLRPGAHDITSIDWQHFMDFADRHERG